jgi:hypothetical protein
MAISKKIRFEVFKRDGFQCAYCGKSPPEVTLECDHVHPVSKGGSDEIENLITACFDCNRGKRNITLDKMPNSLQDNVEVLKEKEKQLREYHKLVARVETRVQNEIDRIELVFQVDNEDKMFTDRFRRSVKKFIKELGVAEVEESMLLARDRFDFANPEHTLKYFCGICWRKIKE